MKIHMKEIGSYMYNPDPFGKDFLGRGKFGDVFRGYK
jgi:hypothetical protein